MFSENASSLILFAGAALALWLVMRRGVSARQSAWRQSRENEDAPRVGAKATLHATDDAPPDVLRWQVEMHETARLLKGELDCKLAALQALVIMARQESERLEAALARRQAFPADSPAELAPSSGEPAPPSDSLSRLAELAEPGQLADRAALAAAADALPGPPAIDPFAEDLRHDRLASEIHRLADQGCSAGEIARRLGAPQGEVELRLSLRNG